ncbi:hypothetical protein LINPERHAP1_LOCUS27189 [Linum perenne]
MACLDMYNSDQQQHKGSHHHHCPPPPPMSPRISFSNDFADSQQMMMMMKQERSSSSSSSSSRHPPPASSSDFEFSVTGYSMMSADELFSKGRILPFKDNSSSSMQRTTIRDELLVDEDSEASSQRPPRGSSGRWKGFLGLRRSHIGSKKVEDRRSGNFVHEQSQVQGCGNTGDMEK